LVVLGRALDPSGSTTHAWWAVALHPFGSAGAWVASAALLVFALPAALSPRAVTR
jgi:hypothetical protein